MSSTGLNTITISRFQSHVKEFERLDDSIGYDEKTFSRSLRTEDQGQTSYSPSAIQRCCSTWQWYCVVSSTRKQPRSFNRSLIYWEMLFRSLQLATRVAFHDHLLPVCLPPPDMKELIAGTNCTVIGWGKKEDKNCEYLFLGMWESGWGSSKKSRKNLYCFSSRRKFYEKWKKKGTLRSAKLFCLFTMTGIQFPFEFLPRSTHSMLEFSFYSVEETLENVDEQTVMCECFSDMWRWGGELPYINIFSLSCFV